LSPNVASLLIVQHTYTQDKDKIYFNLLSLHDSSYAISCLHKCCSQISLTLWANLPWACDLNHLNICEFNSWLQVTFSYDATMIWCFTKNDLLVAWLVIQNSQVLLHLSLDPSALCHRLPFIYAWYLEAQPILFLHLILPPWIKLCFPPTIIAHSKSINHFITKQIQFNFAKTIDHLTFSSRTFSCYVHDIGASLNNETIDMHMTMSLSTFALCLVFSS
jgi:hypothetical protein